MEPRIATPESEVTLDQEFQGWAHMQSPNRNPAIRHSQAFSLSSHSQKNDY